MTNPDTIFAFANLHLYTSLKPYELSPLEIEEERYRGLINNSFIDSLKVHFQKQANKLSITRSIPKQAVSAIKSNRHLKMLVATHRIYEYFTKETKPSLATFNGFLDDLNKKTLSPIDSSSASKPNNSIEDDWKAYLKVLTQSPFTQYKSLKDCVFPWTTNLLLEHLTKCDHSLAGKEFTYELFDTLKFLLRRAGLLNSNILISNRLIKFLPILYGEEGIPKIIASFQFQITELKTTLEKLSSEHVLELEEKISKLKDFHIFYCAQIKELLLKNESRCLRLEEILKTIESIDNPYIKQVIRILREENSLIIKKFYEQISTHEDWRMIYANRSESLSMETIEYPNYKIREFLIKKISVKSS